MHTNPSCFHRYGFGSEGSVEYKIGPDTELVYDVTLKDFKQVGCGSVFHLCFKLKKQNKKNDHKHFVTTFPSQQAKEYWEMDLKEKLDLADGVKNKGNQYFKVFLKPPLWLNISF